MRWPRTMLALPALFMLTGCISSSPIPAIPSSPKTESTEYLKAFQGTLGSDATADPQLTLSIESFEFDAPGAYAIVLIHNQTKRALLLDPNGLCRLLMNASLTDGHQPYTFVYNQSFLAEPSFFFLEVPAEDEFEATVGLGSIGGIAPLDATLPVDPSRSPSRIIATVRGHALCMDADKNRREVPFVWSGSVLVDR